MPFTKSLRCRECGEEYPLAAIYVCENCFGPLEVAYDRLAQKDSITRDEFRWGPRNLWRYRSLLPVERNPRTDLNVGLTPLVHAERLGAQLGLPNLYIKNDTVNPSFSFKDRVVAIASTQALALGFDALACASTGNLAGAVAAHAAHAGLPAYVFIPADLERAKIVAASVYGATIVAVDGNYDQVNRLATQAAEVYGWGFVNINLRPYYAEGSKTLAFEVAEQLGWRAPDRLLAPIASGALFTKIWKGFNEFHELGLLDSALPKMIGAQAEGCAPVATAWHENTRAIRPVKPHSIAKSLAIGDPADGRYAIDVARASGGGIVSVREDSIIEGIQLLARTEGLFAETAGGVVISALRNLAHTFDPAETIVVYITGNGLKTQEVVASQMSRVVHTAPALEAFEHALDAPVREFVHA